MSANPVYWQNDPEWRHEVIAPKGKTSGNHLGGEGCVVTVAGMLREVATGIPTSPHEALRILSEYPGAITDDGLVFWPKAAEAMKLVADEAKASAPDDEGGLHEFAGHQVDENADLAGALGEAFAGGGWAALRVSINSTLKGKHTIAGLGVEADGRVRCSCPALKRIIYLDENLENPDIKWGETPQPYRVVGVRAIRAQT